MLIDYRQGACLTDSVRPGEFLAVPQTPKGMGIDDQVRQMFHRAP
jgi:hypothetical protein